MKKLLAIVISMAMIVAMMPVGVFGTNTTATVTTAEQLKEALEQGGNVQLETDIDISNSTNKVSVPAGKSAILDLNGNTLTAANTVVGNICVYGELTLEDSKGNGKILSKTKYDGSVNTTKTVINVDGNGKFTMESGEIYTSIDEDAENKGNFAIGVWADAEAVINGGKVTAGWFAVATNGSDRGRSHIIVNGGELISIADYAIYAAQKQGSVQINGGTIYGYAGGIAMNGGNLEVNDGVITSKGTGDTGTWGDGTGNLKNAAININAKYSNVMANIKGGKFIAEGDAVVIEKNAANESKVIITGGTFSGDVSAYVADGYVLTEGTVVKNTNSAEAVASIDEQYFKTLAGAIEAVPADDTETQIRMLDNVEIPKIIKVNDNKNIVLDLNGYNIEHKGAFVFDIYNARFHVTGTGTIFENAIDQYAPIMARGASSDIKDYTVITIDKGVTLKGDYSGIFVAKDENGGYNNYGLVINMGGAIDLSTIGNADDENYGYGLYVNGQNVKNDGNTPVINLDGAEVKGATCGIYAAGYAKWNVINSNIEGATGIEIRAGELNIEKGNKITAKVKPTEVEANGNGATTVGAGIAIAQHTTKLPINVKINGGEISGYTALYESNPEKNQKEDIRKVELLISGGSFTAINDGVNAVYSEDIRGFITGGTFSTSPKYLTAIKSLTNYVADEYKVYKISDTEYRVAANNPSGYNWTAADTDEQKAEYDFVGTRIYVPSTPATDNVTNNPADKNTTADLTPAVKDNKAETTVDAKTADKIVEKALENKSEEIIVDATGNNTVASSEVAIPEKTVKELAEKTDANLVIKTDNGKVDLDKAAVKAVADQAGTTGTVKLIVETVKTDADICHVNLKLVTSNGAVTDFKGGNVKVTINLTKELAAKELVCVYIDDNGIYTLVEGVLNADGTYTFTTGHFSEYAVMAKAEADKKIAEQLNTLIKEVNLKVRTSKTAKKNIKAVVSGDVKALTDAGYTVKYKFYRSEKKASKYEAKATKAGKTYINTAGKKGTKYYYKAKALVYDGDKLVGQTVLTQCKYGVRTWSK